jgi:hypothetical protein
LGSFVIYEETKVLWIRPLVLSGNTLIALETLPRKNNVAYLAHL